ncbi:MAG: glycoside hydrolase family 3 N-terminal domain-containing protein [Acidimicrobiales bacterium]
MLLAPTINLHRSPKGGRNFECYSENPVLSGVLATGFVRGVQSRGVAATPKHFVANDSELERNTIDCPIDERTLREVQLLPFEWAVKRGGARGLMSAYNRLNCTHCSEQEWLRERLVGAVARGELGAGALDRIVSHVLGALERAGVLDGEIPSEPSREEPLARPEDRALIRRAAAAGTVLITNDGTDRAGEPRVSGPHALRIVQSGRARVLIDGELVLDATEGGQPGGGEMFGFAPVDIEARMDLEAGCRLELMVEHDSRIRWG